MSAVGVASPSAQGHAMISTATAASNALETSRATTSHPTSVASARTRTTGTKTADTRSASRCTPALPACASATIRAICASIVSEPTFVARTTSLPYVFTVDPATSSPARTSTGTGSPVSSERSTADAPSSTTPSVAIFSPGRTTKRSPTASASTLTTTSRPSRTTRASRAPSSSSARIAAPERRRALDSSHRPSRISVVITAPTSKYVSPMPDSSATTDHAHAASVPMETSVSIVAARCRAFRNAAR